MLAQQRTVAVGVFAERERARDAVGALEDAGFGATDVLLLISSPADAGAAAEETPVPTADRPSAAPSDDAPVGAGIAFGHEEESPGAPVPPGWPEYPVERATPSSRGTTRPT